GASANALNADGCGGAEGAVGVLSARVVLVDLEQGAGERKIAVQELVLGARLQILVLLGRQLLRAGRRSELLERGIERGRVGEIVGLRAGRRDDRRMAVVWQS